MSASNGDRNLLFGILALQMDFISRDALLAAMSAWALDKSRPLGQHLVEAGALAPGRRELLESLVREHLHGHGEDVQQSLASLRPGDTVRRALEGVADVDLQASLRHLGTTPPQEDLGATTPERGPSALAGRRYRPLRPHARGGLGEVFVAHDTELGREVALKEMRPEYADLAAQRARFLREAEVTARLEHPGIVPVYGLGTYDDGRPFYAMRFIRGDTLQQAIARHHAAARERPDESPGERSVRLRQLLRRFLDACNAVEYAHSRGVLHRDLKPGNIMVGPHGETLVVDWGLAKVSEEGATGDGPGQPPARRDDPTLTQAGAALGTPAYMSPEQAEGRLADTGPPSDVYSLGATLYCLLTGRPPFTDGPAGEVLHRVTRGDFPRPRARDATIPPALEAICLKAMALRPEDRYPSPRALAEDLERWLADEPVSAFRESVWARLGRWRRRRRAAVTAAALVLVTLTVAAAVGLIALSREQARTGPNDTEGCGRRGSTTGSGATSMSASPRRTTPASGRRSAIRGCARSHTIA